MQTRTDQAGLTDLKRRNLLVWTIRPHQDSLLIGSESLLLCAPAFGDWIGAAICPIRANAINVRP